VKKGVSKLLRDDPKRIPAEEIAHYRKGQNCLYGIGPNHTSEYGKRAGWASFLRKGAAKSPERGKGKNYEGGKIGTGGLLCVR